MDRVKISIIIPVYKVEQYLCNCVESVINQTCTNWEIILVDDGSPDRCGEICDEYAAKDSRIKGFIRRTEGSHLPVMRVLTIPQKENL